MSNVVNAFAVHSAVLLSDTKTAQSTNPHYPHLHYDEDKDAKAQEGQKNYFSYVLLNRYLREQQTDAYDAVANSVKRASYEVAGYLVALGQVAVANGWNCVKHTSVGDVYIEVEKHIVDWYKITCSFVKEEVLPNFSFIYHGNAIAENGSTDYCSGMVYYLVEDEDTQKVQKWVNLIRGGNMVTLSMTRKNEEGTEGYLSQEEATDILQSVSNYLKENGNMQLYDDSQLGVTYILSYPNSDGVLVTLSSKWQVLCVINADTFVYDMELYRIMMDAYKRISK